ncbi:hypothetical protein CAOG_06619 [Capsaspora owczarzaki ATCC 30864]|uniref:NOD3 protein n=1 Tax=Capsaspora owczarzaki (strain ATCC 30864) TaxID=595528 RepID=A0A0D2UMJ9_CAPO3|nr:hypothetical protein CAOG_06619 [Capsaspora owczarzaki ATCC 30864]KJE96276.1 hypothetical protein CAOG_006619 [Capsaspora owczarzaki ATCC 30864]|eukprot:XP_004344240.1 hypothetical protein CAOG_06619 [Capsaspora owczarzaki ATCC 30864]
MLSYDDMTERQREVYDYVKNEVVLMLSGARMNEAEAQAVVEGLKVNTKLIFLSLSTNPIAAVTIADLLRVNKTIQNLFLQENQIGDADAVAIADALKVNTTLNDLDLKVNQIGDAGAVAIADALKLNMTLKKLRLDENQIGDAGAVAIANALKLNTTLARLLLVENQIGKAGAQAIAEALTVNTTVTELRLDKNQIGDAGAQAIAEALKVNTTLTELRLHQTQIGDVGAQAIAEALKVNTTLIDLQLSGNQIGDIGAQAIAEALKGNPTGITVDLNSNCIDRAFVQLVKQAQKTKNRGLYLSNDTQFNPLVFSLLPRLASTEDIQAVLGMLTSGLELENQSQSLPALPTEIAELIMDEAYYWQGVQHAKRMHGDQHYTLTVTVPRSVIGNSIRVKTIQVLREWKLCPDTISDCVFDLTVQDEQGAVRYECLVQPTFVDSNLLQLATIWPANHPILRQMREGWQVRVARSKSNEYVRFEALYVGYV